MENKLKIAVIGLGMEYEREGRDKPDLALPKEQIGLLHIGGVVRVTLLFRL